MFAFFIRLSFPNFEVLRAEFTEICYNTTLCACFGRDGTHCPVPVRVTKTFPPAYCRNVAFLGTI